MRALSADKTIKYLQQATVDDATPILTRLAALLEENIDPQYAHPKDIPIAAYLYVLSSTKQCPIVTIEQVLQTPNLMWAKRLAETILANQTLPT